jgi:hypothetical protein
LGEGPTPRTTGQARTWPPAKHVTRESTRTRQYEHIEDPETLLHLPVLVCMYARAVEGDSPPGREMRRPRPLSPAKTSLGDSLSCDPRSKAFP